MLFKNNITEDKMAKTTANYESPNQSINIISEGTKIKGDVIANGDIRIDGELLGNISAKSKLVIGPKGKIEGQIICNNIEISGYVKGKVTATDLINMKSTSQIVGDIIAGKLSIEPGAVFSGSCMMNGTNPLNGPEKPIQK
ncbi:MAG TPA: polymer-forming cytoskeletal protein [Draconibacterium sp.]|nr:polymer-forming cytoskeletal protein [Draconibacterium sp.]